MKINNYDLSRKLNQTIHFKIIIIKQLQMPKQKTRKTCNFKYYKFPSMRLTETVQSNSASLLDSCLQIVSVS